MSINPIALSDLRAFIAKTQTSNLAPIFIKIVTEAINIHADHLPVIGIVDMLNYKDTQVLIMWTKPFDSYTTMIKISLLNIEPYITDMFARRTLRCGLYIGINSDIIFSDCFNINEENSKSNDPLFNWHYRLIENNYDRIEPIVPSFLSHILDQAEKHIVVPEEIAQALIQQAEDHAVAPEDFIPEDDF